MPSTAATPQGWGPQRSDETALTGDALTKVTAVAKDALPGATIVRVETDADGNATYEAHVTKSDGSLATVYVDETLQARQRRKRTARRTDRRLRCASTARDHGLRRRKAKARRGDVSPRRAPGEATIDCVGGRR